MKMDNISLKALWGKAIGVAVTLMAAVALLVGGAPGNHAVPHSTAVAELRLAATTVPQSAWTTLGLIDKGQWPSANCPNSQGGAVFENREGLLPAGVDYQEWDVNCKQADEPRDAERIVTGSDKSAWYTGDHYATFTRMR